MTEPISSTGAATENQAKQQRLATLASRIKLLTYSAYAMLMLGLWASRKPKGFVPGNGDAFWFYLMWLVFLVPVVVLAKGLRRNLWLYGILGLIPVVNAVVFFKLYFRGKKALESEGYTFTYLDVIPPVRRSPSSTNTTDDRQSKAPLDSPTSDGASRSAIARWMRISFRTCLWTLFVGLLFCLLCIVINPGKDDETTLILLITPMWIAFGVSALSFVLFMLVGFARFVLYISSKSGVNDIT